RLLLEEAQHRLTLEHEQLGGLERRGARRARLAVEQRDLAQHLAGVDEVEHHLAALGAPGRAAATTPTPSASSRAPGSGCSGEPGRTDEPTTPQPIAPPDTPRVDTGCLTPLPDPSIEGTP